MENESIISLINEEWEIALRINRIYSRKITKVLSSRLNEFYAGISVKVDCLFRCITIRYQKQTYIFTYAFNEKRISLITSQKDVFNKELKRRIEKIVSDEITHCHNQM